MDIGGLPLRGLLVRISDFGDATTIKNSEEVDGDEIVVTAQSKKKPRHALSLGRGFLEQCSSLTFDYTIQQVKMSCAL
jgi:ABC-type hemin transport system ATPase subunit